MSTLPGGDGELLKAAGERPPSPAMPPATNSPINKNSSSMMRLSGSSMLSTSTNSSPKTTRSPGTSPARKRLKLDLSSAKDVGIEEKKRKLYENRLARLQHVSNSYRDNMLESFFLEHQLNITDIPTFRRRPTQAYLSFLRTNNAPERIISEVETIVLGLQTSSQSHPTGSISSVSASSSPTTAIVATAPPLQPLPPPKPKRPVRQFTCRVEVPVPVMLGRVQKPYSAERASRARPSLAPEIPPPSAQHYSIQQVQDKIKQEGWVLRRVAELSRDGMWSSKRLPRVVERPRPVSAWDLVLEEMKWMAEDFRQERAWKKAAAQLQSAAVKSYVEERTARETELKQRLANSEAHREIAARMSAHVRRFWRESAALCEVELGRRQAFMTRGQLEGQLSHLTDFIQTEHHHHDPLTTTTMNSEASLLLKRRMSEVGSTETDSMVPSTNDIDGRHVVGQLDNCLIGVAKKNWLKIGGNRKDLFDTANNTNTNNELESPGSPVKPALNNTALSVKNELSSSANNADVAGATTNGGVVEWTNGPTIDGGDLLNNKMEEDDDAGLEGDEGDYLDGDSSSGLVEDDEESCSSSLDEQEEWEKENVADADRELDHLEADLRTELSILLRTRYPGALTHYLTAAHPGSAFKSSITTTINLLNSGRSLTTSALSENYRNTKMSEENWFERRLDLVDTYSDVTDSDDDDDVAVDEVECRRRGIRIDSLLGIISQKADDEGQQQNSCNSSDRVSEAAKRPRGREMPQDLMDISDKAERLLPKSVIHKTTGALPENNITLSTYLPPQTTTAVGDNKKLSHAANLCQKSITNSNANDEESSQQQQNAASNGGAGDNPPRLRDYQYIAMEWLLKMHAEQLPAILGDEEGLGRRVIIAAFLSQLALTATSEYQRSHDGNNDVGGQVVAATASPHNNQSHFPHLLVVPVSALSRWETVLRLWCPRLTTRVYAGDWLDRKQLRRDVSLGPGTVDVLLVAYRNFHQDRVWFLKRRWGVSVLAQVQNIVAAGSKDLVDSLCGLKAAQRVLVMSGPLKENPIDLWHLLYLLYPVTRHLHSEFKSGTVDGTVEYSETVRKLQGILRRFTLARSKAKTPGLDKQIPQPREVPVYINLNARQRKFYEDYLSRSSSQEVFQSGDIASVSSIIWKLRSICNHPDLVEVNSADNEVDAASWAVETGNGGDCERNVYRHKNRQRLEVGPLPSWARISKQPSRKLMKLLEPRPLDTVSFENINLVFLKQEMTTTVLTSARLRSIKASQDLIQELASHTPGPGVPPPPASRFPAQYPPSHKAPTNKIKFTIEGISRTVGGGWNLPGGWVEGMGLVRAGTGQVYKVFATPRSSSSTQSTTGMLAMPQKSGGSMSEPTTSKGIVSGGESKPPMLANLDSLASTAAVNQWRCSGFPLYGQDLIKSVEITNSIRPVRSRYRGQGYINCLTADPERPREELQDWQYGVSHLADLVAVGSELTARTEHKLASWKPDAASTEKQDPRSRSAKLKALDKVLLDRIRSSVTGKTVLYTSMPEMLPFIQQYCSLHSIRHTLMSSNMELSDRVLAVERFRIEPRLRLLVVAGIESFPGLVFPSNVENLIYLDSRPGQSEHLVRLLSWNLQTVYRLICRDTVEDGLTRKPVQRKLVADMDKVPATANSTNSTLKKQTLEDLLAPKATDNGYIWPAEKKKRGDKVKDEYEEREAVDQVLSLLGGACADQLPTDELLDLAELDTVDMLLSVQQRDDLQDDDVDTTQWLESIPTILRYGMSQMKESGGLWDPKAWSRPEELMADTADSNIRLLPETEKLRIEGEIADTRAKAQRGNSLEDFVSYPSELAWRTWQHQQQQEREKDSSTATANVGESEPATVAPSAAKNSSTVVVHPWQFQPGQLMPPNGEIAPGSTLDTGPFTTGLLYSVEPMAEEDLPPVHVKKDRKRDSAGGLVGVGALGSNSRAVSPLAAQQSLGLVAGGPNGSSGVGSLMHLEKGDKFKREDNDGSANYNMVATAPPRSLFDRPKSLNKTGAGASGGVLFGRTGGATAGRGSSIGASGGAQSAATVTIGGFSGATGAAGLLASASGSIGGVTLGGQANASVISGSLQANAVGGVVGNSNSGQLTGGINVGQALKSLTPVAVSGVGGQPTVTSGGNASSDGSGPKWLIQEDWALYQAVCGMQTMPLSLQGQAPALLVNWHLVADMVNAVSRSFRSPRQCRARFDSVVAPREEGRNAAGSLFNDITPPAALAGLGGNKSGNSGSNKNSKKLKVGNKHDKSLSVQSSGGPIKTTGLFKLDNNSSWSSGFSSRFESIKAIANKRTPTTKPLMVNSTTRNPKHAAVLAECGINYENPLSPIQIAKNRAERLQRENLIKQRSQQAAQLAAQLASQQQSIEIDHNKTVQQQQIVVGTNVQPQQARIVTAGSVIAASHASGVTMSAGSGGQQQAVVVGLSQQQQPHGATAGNIVRSVVSASGVPTVVTVTTGNTVVGTATGQLIAANPSQHQAQVVQQNHNASGSVVASGTTNVARLAGGQIVVTSNQQPTAIVGTSGGVNNTGIRSGTTVGVITSSGASGSATNTMQVTTGRQLTPAQYEMFKQQAILKQQQLQRQKLQQQQQQKQLQLQQQQQQQGVIAAGQQQLVGGGTVSATNAVVQQQTGQLVATQSTGLGGSNNVGTATLVVAAQQQQAAGTGTATVATSVAATGILKPTASGATLSAATAAALARGAITTVAGAGGQIIRSTQVRNLTDAELRALQQQLKAAGGAAGGGQVVQVQNPVGGSGASGNATQLQQLSIQMQPISSSATAVVHNQQHQQPPPVTLTTVSSIGGTTPTILKSVTASSGGGVASLLPQQLIATSSQQQGQQQQQLATKQVTIPINIQGGAAAGATTLSGQLKATAVANRVGLQQAGASGQPQQQHYQQIRQLQLVRKAGGPVTHQKVLQQVGGPGGKGATAQLIVQGQQAKGLPATVTVQQLQQIVKSVAGSGAAQAVQIGSAGGGAAGHMIAAKSPSGQTVQARVIPVSAAAGLRAGSQTIQVVVPPAGSSGRITAAPNVSLDALTRGGTTAAAGSSSSNALVSALASGNPVKISAATPGTAVSQILQMTAAGMTAAGGQNQQQTGGGAGTPVSAVAVRTVPHTSIVSISNNAVGTTTLISSSTASQQQQLQRLVQQQSGNSGQQQIVNLLNVGPPQQQTATVVSVGSGLVQQSGGVVSVSSSAGQQLQQQPSSADVAGAATSTNQSS